MTDTAAFRLDGPGSHELLLDAPGSMGPVSNGSVLAQPTVSSAAELAPMTLYVCTTCRDADHDASEAAGEPCAGTRLHTQLLAASPDPAIRIVGVKCLSVCKRPCAVSFVSPDKWTYVFGDLPADSAAAIVLTGARLYMETPDGVIPWKLRHEAFKKGAVARVPAAPPPA